ncbi:uncharacterized protein BDV14DRAFT_204059 [Aspergillus stella-maris]|uniref:uncharacterized protein n=1 Tax=Aspergillus stella-maris TaxID=1810926 RepID=UPI003CCDE800
MDSSVDSKTPWTPGRPPEGAGRGARELPLRREAARIQRSVGNDDINFPIRPSSQELGIPILSKASTPKPGRLQGLQFSESKTAKIRQQGRETGLGLTALIYAVLLQACNSMTVSAHQDIHTSNTAIAQKGKYRNIAEIKDKIEGESISCLQDSLPLLLGKEPPFFASFIGDISPLFGSTYGPLELTEAWIALIPMTPIMYLVVQTFQEQLAVRLSYNEAYWSDEQVAVFLGKIKKELDHQVLRKGVC